MNLFNSIPLSFDYEQCFRNPKDKPAKKYCGVIVKRDTENGSLIFSGDVVTHLALDHWALLHKYTICSISHVVVAARPEEKTRLR